MIQEYGCEFIYDEAYNAMPNVESLVNGIYRDDCDEKLDVRALGEYCNVSDQNTMSNGNAIMNNNSMGGIPTNNDSMGSMPMNNNSMGDNSSSGNVASDLTQEELDAGTQAPINQAFLNDVTPPLDQDENYVQGYLQQHIGSRVKVDFLIGTNSTQDRIGDLIQVGISYIVLKDPNTKNLVMCDMYSIKFVTIYNNPLDAL